MQTILWPHQRTAIDQLRASLRSGKRRPLVASPTGSGKTVLAAAIVEAALEKGNRVAFTVPAISLVDQTVAKFYREGIREVGVIQADHRGTDWSKPVQVCSVDTLHSREAYPDASVVIADEAHVVKKGLLRWMAERPELPFIGLSATPWRKGLGRIFDDLIVAATIKALIADGLLAKHRTFAPSHPDLTGVRTTAGEFNGADLGKVADQKALVGDVVETWQQLGGDRPTICFAVDCAHAKLLQERFKDAGIPAAYVDHTMCLIERAEVERDFRAGRAKVLCNVDCLGLGVDLPEVACISYARPTRSIVRWVQNIGRGLRVAKDKQDLVILDHSDTTLRLGFVDDIAIEGLDDGQLKPDRERDEEKRELLPKACPACAFVKPPGARECPQCGHIIERKTSARHVGGELAELDGEGLERERKRRNKHWAAEDKLTFFRMLLGYFQAKGSPKWRGAAAHKYREKFGVWPNGFGHPAPMTPNADVLSWIRSRNIAWARRHRHEQNA